MAGDPAVPARPVGKPRSVLRWVGDAGSALLVALWIVHRISPSGIVGTTVALAPQWLWPALSLLFLALAARSRSVVSVFLAVLVALPASMFLSGFSTGAGRSTTRGTDDVELRVVTWNVHNQYGRVAQIVGQLQEIDADVICLQEASDKAFDGLFPGMEEVHSTSLKVYVRGSLRPWQEAREADPLFQRWLPLVVDAKGVRLRLLPVHLHGRVGGYRLMNDRSRLDEYLAGMRRTNPRQIETIARVARGPDPVLICGDLNTPPLSPALNVLRDECTDAFALAGLGLGLTYLLQGKVSAWRIDYIWCGGGVRPVRCFTGKAGPSDHRPVIADIVVPGAG